MLDKEYKKLSRRITWSKFKYLCTRNPKYRILYNTYLTNMKHLICVNIENFRNNRHLKMNKL